MTAYTNHHTHVTTPDPEKLVEFYTKKMGANVVKRLEIGGNVMVDIDLGGIPIRISKGTAADNDWQGLRHGLHHLGLTVEDLDACIAELEAGGAEVVKSPFELNSSGIKRAAFVKAPDGVLIELLEKSPSYNY